MLYIYASSSSILWSWIASTQILEKHWQLFLQLLGSGSQFIVSIIIHTILQMIVQRGFPHCREVRQGSLNRSWKSHRDWHLRIHTCWISQSREYLQCGDSKRINIREKKGFPQSMYFRGGEEISHTTLNDTGNCPIRMSFREFLRIFIFSCYW
jgi:hypothetical protein